MGEQAVCEIQKFNSYWYCKVHSKVVLYTREPTAPCLVGQTTVLRSERDRLRLVIANQLCVCGTQPNVIDPLKHDDDCSVRHALGGDVQ